MPKSLFCLFLMLFSLLLLQAESFAEFRNRLMEQDWKTAEGMIKDFLSQSKDLEAMRELQDLCEKPTPRLVGTFSSRLSAKNQVRFGLTCMSAWKRTKSIKPKRPTSSVSNIQSSIGATGCCC